MKIAHLSNPQCLVFGATEMRLRKEIAGAAVQKITLFAALLSDITYFPSKG